MTSTLEQLRGRVATAVDDLLRRDLEAAITSRRQDHGEHREWALLCEQAGLMSLAFSEFQLALRDDPQDPMAMFHLAQHYREHGESARAAGLLSQLLDRAPAQSDWLTVYVELLREDGAEPRAEEAIQRAAAAGLPSAEAERLRRSARRRTPQRDAQPGRGQPDLVPDDADCVRFHTRFNGREGVYARQWVRPNGEAGYTPVHEPLTPAVIRNHLLGTYTVGVYPIRVDGTATFFALDLDIDKPALQQARADHAYAQFLRDTLRREGPRLVMILRELGFEPLLENSGYKGRHLWVFLDAPQTAESLHLLGRMLLSWQSRELPPGLHLEFFPKQAGLSKKGLGNLIKLPLGIHRRTGYRSLLLDDRSDVVADPFAVLRAVVPASQDTLFAAVARLKGLGWDTAGRTPDSHTKATEPADHQEPPPHVAAPPPPDRGPLWTEADFEADPRVRHLLRECPVLAELKRHVDEHRQLHHEEQLVLIHSLGHLEGGPQAVNYLFGKCIDVGPEKRMKDRLKGNPVSCPSIRKKIPHVTRRVRCNCPFEFAKDRYPTPVLHLLTLSESGPAAMVRSAVDASLVYLAQRYGVAERRRAEILREWEQLRDALATALRGAPDRAVSCEGGRYQLLEKEGIEELVWYADGDTTGPSCTP